MSEFAVEGLLLKEKDAALRMGEEGVGLRVGGEKIALLKEDIKTVEVFRATRGFCLRVSTAEATYDLLNLHESMISRLRTACAQLYGITLAVTELETLDTVHGDLLYANGVVTLQGARPVFSIPKEAIGNIVELKDELEFHLGDTEIVFHTTSNVSQLLGNKLSEVACVVNDINCLHPRSKSTLIFYDSHFVLKGSSYDHPVLYSDVEEMQFLRRDTQHYLVTRLATPVVQGQTRYEALVFLVGDREIDVAAADPRLKPFYSGDQADVLLDIMEALIKIKAQESITSFQCTSKVFEGHLFCLPSALQFLPKSLTIPLSEISYVEFSRINLSLAQAKTFDLTVFAGKVHYFKGIHKDKFNDLELYFNDNGIKMVSEVIEESESYSHGDSSGSDLSNIIDSDE
ncbi:structure-specific recognition protein 1 [Pancytospora philotis]|nr:structure-specific recognition protein 1 [Pancytospora philotis]